MKRLLALFPLAAILSLVFFSAGCSRKGYTSASRHKATMHPYRVRGKHYRPSYVAIGQKMRGVSSWYGPNFHGKQTSNGERYNMHARTAAHKTWPMDTMVKVKNLQNGKSTIVRINDRGPFVHGRIIDCSYAAGRQIGLNKTGVAKVEIEVVGFAGKVQPAQSVAKQKKVLKVSKERERAVPYVTRVRLSNFAIQVGAFKRYEGARVYQRRYARIDYRYNSVIKRPRGMDRVPLYRVWLMGFESEQEANAFRQRHGLADALIVRE